MELKLLERFLAVLEHGSADDPPEFSRLSRVDSRKYGDTSLAFYEVTQS